MTHKQIGAARRQAKWIATQSNTPIATIIKQSPTHRHTMNERLAKIKDYLQSIGVNSYISAFRAVGLDLTNNRAELYKYWHGAPIKPEHKWMVDQMEAAVERMKIVNQ